MASLVWRVQNLVVEDREVKGESKSDWVRWRKVVSRDFSGSFVGFKGFVGTSFSLVGHSKFCEISVVVALPI